MQGGGKGRPNMSSNTNTNTVIQPSRVWFITGTSSGLGKALVESLLLEAGSEERVVAITRNASSLTYLANAELKQHQSQRLLIHEIKDISNSLQVAEAFSAAVKRLGRVDVLVNNAGYALIGEVEAIPLEDARKAFDVGFWGAVNCTKEAARVFREINPPGAGGHIFNISSIGGYMANPTLAYYSASKFALEGFTEAFAKEMEGSWGIKATIIEPGGFESEWRGASAHITPPHPAYTGAANPCAGFRKIHENNDMPLLGSTAKMAKTLRKLVDTPDLPLRVQFGTESLWFVTSQPRKTGEDAERFREVARSTDRDGVDGDMYVREVLLKSGNFERNKA